MLFTIQLLMCMPILTFVMQELDLTYLTLLDLLNLTYLPPGEADGGVCGAVSTGGASAVYVPTLHGGQGQADGLH